MSSMATSGSEQPHILVFPFPAQGHMLPLLDLTHHLALQDFVITIIITPKNLQNLGPLLSAHPTTIHTLVLPFPPYPTLPAGVENVRDIGNPGNIPIINAFGKLQDPIIQWFESHPNPPVALVSDFFLGWTLHLARRINIPRIAFFSSGAFVCSVLDECWSLLSAPKESSSSAVEFPDLPGSPCFKEEHLPSVFLRCRESTLETDFVKDSLIANFFSWGCVFNTFDGLEGEYLRYLRKKVGHRRVYGVGPLSLLGIEERPDLENNHNCADVVAWLDECPDDSVLYVCFGSQKVLKRQQMEALASGLERSGVQFIWVVKTGTAEQVAIGDDVIPDGFEKRVGRRGLVINGWAPQVLILSHRAVGGFLSHCGWNSTLEGVVAGVRILGWPMEADQHVNARLLVEDIAVAVRACEGAEGVPDPAELGNAIAQLMSGGAPEKMRAKKLRQKALAAVSGGGSSLNNLDELVRELRQLRKPVANDVVKK
ncbi:UDP-glucuronosyl/UDP-glucosyltransferase [Parasponia andersonii]|uniref:Glycosyltransferase n=1 Tax=Parasponia andersonii TaxID=3476 RepID=A0A2P5E2N4_PARAD|nr:UDP-glucuronosyl/UDP-glucosyltransferase [Parasponia andersonii]